MAVKLVGSSDEDFVKMKVRKPLAFRYECKTCCKRYKRVNWAYLHSVKFHEGNSKFKILGVFKDKDVVE